MKGPIIIIKPEVTLIDGKEVMPQRIDVLIDDEPVSIKHLIEAWPRKSIG